jgi:hypothetical protein
MLFLLPGQAKVYIQVCHKSLCPSIKRGEHMTLYQWGEDDLFDLQRMPGQKRPTHTPERKDPTIHTIDHPFCYDPACSCHSNQEARERVRQWVHDGLMTEDEASNYLAGRTL